MQKVAEVDNLKDRNCPSMHIEKGDLLWLEIYSPSLDGLSQIDFQLAVEIQKINEQDYHLIAVSDKTNYKKGIHLCYID